MELATIPLENISIEHRYRKDLGDIEDLAASIKKVGIITPIAVSREDDGSYRLVAGERRVRASRIAGLTEIPAHIYEATLSDYDRIEIELLENIKRLDMSWREEAEAKKALHDMEIARHGKKVSTAADAPGWTMQDTAKMLGVSRALISDQIKLASALEEFPEVFEGCKTQSDARKVLDKIARTAVHDSMAREFEATSSNSTIDKLIQRYIIKDCFEGLAGLVDGSLDWAEVDPPYANNYRASMREAGRSALEAGEYHEISADEYPSFVNRLAKELYRVLAANSWLFFWHSHLWTPMISKALRDAGFEVAASPIVWVKDKGSARQPALYLANYYEPCMYARKGRPVIAKPGRSNVFFFPTVPHQHKIHPTERPLELIRELLEVFCFPNTNGIVPFLGSGNSIIAAHQAKMSAFGFELSKSYRNDFVVRLKTELTSKIDES